MARWKIIVLVVVGFAGYQWIVGSGGRTDAAANHQSPHEPHASGDESGQFIVHEWGTFTTFSGSDGVFLDFRPLAAEHNDLPAYVLDRASFAQYSLFSKSRLRGRVRMETPVTYFYTDRIRTVDVSVEFPQGLLTEFYPPVQEIQPPLDEKVAFTTGETVGNSSLHWGTIDLIPQQALVPGITAPQVRTSLAQQLAHLAVPHGANEQHYAHAREVDAALVHTRPQSGSAPFGMRHADCFEKFLFYRGVGSFELPVAVTFDDAQRPQFTNHGSLEVRHAILIESHSGQLKAKHIDAVPPGKSATFADADTVTIEQLGAIVQQSLEAEGLYRREAQAMVNTWKDSWFAEDGRRVLYMVPHAITEELLPLHIEPAPQERLRVLVGRMEVMSPADEARLTAEVHKSKVAREAFVAAHTPRKKGDPLYAIPDAILAWGRMTEPALVRIAKSADDPATQQEAEKLLATLRHKAGA